ncbi:MAG TPA: hypothetical protein VE863_09610 [Pyrinomonadaceae bacterium]|jgi:hypothetical protein|nr:hypothetical protein [Pyrinomonadaceae bacterium]
MSKSEVLFSLAQALAGERPTLFQVKGPGVGDHDTGSFIRELRNRALEAFGMDFAEKNICGENNLRVDYHFPDEETIVEVAFGLRNPLSEYERDILKAIISRECGYAVSRLLFISKPGAQKRLSQPGASAINRWAAQQGITIEVRELSSNSQTFYPQRDER